MLSKARDRLTYANVMATIAVFLALGGGAYAAFQLPRNSVGTAQVRDRSLLERDFKAGQLPEGEQGPRGDPGPSASLETALIGGQSLDNVDPATRSKIIATTITTTKPGRLLIHAKNMQAQVECGDAAGGCAVEWGVYLDDKPVKNAGFVVGGEPNTKNVQPVLIWALAPDVPAGTHRLDLSVTERPGTTPASTFFGNDPAIEAISIG